MEKARTNPPFAGASATLLVVVAFTLIFIIAARTPLDSDLWWHLRAGQATVESRAPLLEDSFSFTRAGAHWVNHSWLSQVGLILLYQAGGYFALGLVVALIAAASMALVYRQSEGPVGLRVVSLLLGSVVASTVWMPRPQIVSLALLALVGWLLFLYKRRGKNVLWALPPVFLLWSNLHGGYAAGFLWIGAFLCGEAGNHLLGLRGEQVLSWRKIGALALWALAAGFAVLINPNGIDAWRIPFQTVSIGALQQFISEWASPDFHQLLQQSFLWLLFAVFAAVALSGKVMDGADLAPAVLFSFMALTARRNFGPAAIVLVPVLTRYGAEALRQWQSRIVMPAWLAGLNRSQGGAAPARRGLNLAIAGLLFFTALAKLYVVTQPVLVGGYASQAFPADGAAWVAEHAPSTRLLNEYNDGGYLLWRLPAARVFVDGRTDLFGDEIIGQWMTLVEAGQGWQEILARYPVDLVMLDPDRPLIAELEKIGWQPVYSDDQVVIVQKTLAR